MLHEYKRGGAKILMKLYRKSASGPNCAFSAPGIVVEEVYDVIRNAQGYPMKLKEKLERILIAWGVWECPHCGTENSDSSVKCSNCGI
jgi:uncharacterized protein (UPF0212 family)